MKFSNEMILFYNFNQADLMKKWKGICFRLGIRIKEISPEEFGQPLGYLAGLPGFDSAEPAHDPGAFSEPMLVLKNFNTKRIDELLRQTKKAGVPNVPLKAVLTVHNFTWNSVELYEELAREHQAMQQGKTIHTDT